VNDDELGRIAYEALGSPVRWKDRDGNEMEDYVVMARAAR